MRALLALEDGSVFHGRAFGSTRETGGEVVFNTSMTGYQEILTDPSYHAQIVVFTASHLGNYGIHEFHGESLRPRAAGMVAREVSEVPCHPGSIQSLPAWMREHDRFGLAQIDTRALTLLLRRKGSLRGWMTTQVEDPDEAVERAQAIPRMEKIQAVPAVTTRSPYLWREISGSFGELERLTLRAGVRRPEESGPRVAVLDCGVKFNILRQLSVRGCRVTVVPAETPAAALEEMAPDGLVLSNGPGDPSALAEMVPQVRKLVERFPTLAICLGHQLASLALGCRTVKLPFGHHGGNHPVKDLRTGHVLITAQNHNYAVDPSSLRGELEVTHVNLNDGTVEGFRHRELPLWSLQYHPEASPGPHEGEIAFDDFVGALGGHGEQSDAAGSGRPGGTGDPDAAR